MRHGDGFAAGRGAFISTSVISTVNGPFISARIGALITQLVIGLAFVVSIALAIVGAITFTISLVAFAVSIIGALLTLAVVFQQRLALFVGQLSQLFFGVFHGSASLFSGLSGAVAVFGQHKAQQRPQLVDGLLTGILLAQVLLVVGRVDTRRLTTDGETVVEG
ncbi:hypothetical protein D3C72_1845080 [compost metagenome]